MAMASKMVGVLLLVLLLALTQTVAPASPLSAAPEAGPAAWLVSQRVPRKVFP
ncbi:hypothetical protein ZWY2020_041103 [Hordeum vulgare]|nr:hypothetical protein ZWY2020_041103 [Hordeum vulgare]